MKTDCRAKAEVPTEHRAAGIRWLVVQFDAQSQGWFLFGHRSLEEPSEFDSWHETRSGALQEAERHWGVQQMTWEELK